MARFKCDRFRQIRESYSSSTESYLTDSDYSMGTVQQKARITRAKLDRAAMARALNNHMARCKVCS